MMHHLHSLIHLELGNTVVALRRIDFLGVNRPNQEAFRFDGK